MPVDGGIVVGYLTAFLLKGGKRLADRGLESLLDRLVRRVEDRLGHGPLDTLRQHPRDPGAEAAVSDELERAMAYDGAFAAELARLVHRLDTQGGRQLVNQVYAQTNVQSFGPGMAAGRDIVYAPPPRDPSDMSDAPAWVKVLAVVGVGLCLAGFAFFGHALFTHNPDFDDPGFMDVPPGVVRGGVLFFAGFVVLAIASIGRSMTKREHRPPW